MPVKPGPAFLRPKEACNYLDVGRTTLHKIYIADIFFPRKIYLSKRLIGWRKTDIDAWLATKAKKVKV